MTDTVVCVGAVVQRESSVLLVRQASGHSLEGQWTMPWGQLEPGESPSVAVLREIREEGGVSAEISGLLGIQELPEPWLGMIGILFFCKHISGEATPDHIETDAAGYFTLDEIDAFGDSVETLSGWLARRVLSDESHLLARCDSNPFAPAILYA